MTIYSREDRLPLPAELVLLLHKPEGRPYFGIKRDVIAPAAELAELALRGRVELEYSIFGNVKLRPLDTKPSGVFWLDRAIDALADWCGPAAKPISFSSWLTARGLAFEQHRAGLYEAGLLTHREEKVFGFIRADRYLPDERERVRLIDDLVALARKEKSPDDRLAMLVALAYPSKLAHEFVDGWSERRTLKSISRGEMLGDAVARVVAAAARGVAAASGGGDGGGDGGGS